MSPLGEATGLPVRRPDQDPRTNEPAWCAARQHATRLAVQHFEGRGDLTAQKVQTFIWRETLRALGEPIPTLFYGWGRTVANRVKPTVPPELQAVIAQEARQWQTT